MFRSPERMILVGAYPAAPLAFRLWLTVALLIFGGFLLGRWLHPGLLILALLGIVLLMAVKLEICWIDQSHLHIGNGLWWQWQHYQRDAIEAVDLETWMLEDTDPLERDVLYRVILRLNTGQTVPIRQRWHQDQQKQQQLITCLREYLGHG
ncbi:MAG: hypothetical protein Q6K08_01670 [Thermostichales cyanobacterium GMQP_bins_62]